MSVTTTEKPGKGKPQTQAQKAAVLAMEAEVVDRYAVRGQSFYRIERELGITHADRVYKRAMSVRPVQQRTEAYEVQRQRLDALHEKAWEALEADGLDSLAIRVTEMIREHDPEDGESALSERVRSVIERAYADTYKGIPVALGVHDRFVKLDGLDHAARIADANLALDMARVQMFGTALATVLAEAGLDAEAQRAGVVRWSEIVSVEPSD